MADAPTLAALVCLGVWAALDGTAVGQVLISRPMVSSTLAGLVLGDPETGFLVGVILEGAHFGELPIGGARVPEPGPASIPAVAAALRIGGPGGLALGAAIGVVWALLAGSTVTAQRRLNGLVVREPRGGWRRPGQLAVRHWTCIALDGIRGAALTGAGLALVATVPETLGGRWPFSVSATVAFLLLPAFLSVGSVIGTWDTSSRKVVLLMGGCAAGLALALLP